MMRWPHATPLAVPTECRPSKPRNSFPRFVDRDSAAACVYHDGQFDDARLLISMIRTASDQGARVLNYAAATRLIKDREGRITGVG